MSFSPRFALPTLTEISEGGDEENEENIRGGGGGHTTTVCTLTPACLTSNCKNVGSLPRERRTYVAYTYGIYCKDGWMDDRRQQAQAQSQAQFTVTNAVTQHTHAPPTKLTRSPEGRTYKKKFVSACCLCLLPFTACPGMKCTA